MVLTCNCCKKPIYTDEPSVTVHADCIQIDRLREEGLIWCNLAHDWMKAHDQLLGWIQNNPVAMREMLSNPPKIDLPKPRE